MSFIIDPYRHGPPLPQASLELSGSNYLTQTNSGWGPYNRALNAIAGAIRLDTSATTSTIFSKYDGDVGTSNEEIQLRVMSSNKLDFRAYANGADAQLRATATIADLTWAAFLVHFDSANATSGDRMRMWIDGVEITVFDIDNPPTGPIQTTTEGLTIGCELNGGSPNNYFDGLINQLTFFSGYLPTPAEVFGSGAGKLKSLINLPGAHSLLDASSAENDAILATNWGNVGSVSTNVSIP